MDGSASAVVRYAAGTCLVTENDLSRKMFIIKEGKARVFKNHHGRRVTLAILGQGEVFGEMSFFDGEPRSASVEALTDITAIVIDGENVRKQLPAIPDWIFPIIRMTIRRFRIADQKLAVLQAMSEFQKRSFQTDPEAKTIYLEMLRFLKVLKMAHSKIAVASGKPAPVPSQALLAEMDDVLGNRSIGLKTFWRTMKENDFIDHELEENKGIVALREEEIEMLTEFLHTEVERETYLLLSHPALSLLRRLLGTVHEHGLNEPEAITPIADLDLENLPLAQEALQELTKQSLIIVADGNVRFNPGRIAETYGYQNVLKTFDHTSMNLE